MKSKFLPGWENDRFKGRFIFGKAVRRVALKFFIFIDIPVRTLREFFYAIYCNSTGIVNNFPVLPRPVSRNGQSLGIISKKSTRRNALKLFSFIDTLA